MGSAVDLGSKYGRGLSHGEIASSGLGRYPYLNSFGPGLWVEIFAITLQEVRSVSASMSDFIA
jgi:hypothetical protein